MVNVPPLYVCALHCRVPKKIAASTTTAMPMIFSQRINVRVSGRVFTALKALHEKHVVRGEPVRQQESDSEDEGALDFNAPAEVVYDELADRYALPLWNELTAKRQNLLRAEFAAAGYAIESAKFRFVAESLRGQ